MQLPCCHTLLSHHTPEHFPFLRLHENRHLRTNLHQTLARLIFMQPAETVDSAFGTFMEPILQTLSDLACLQPQQMRSDSRVQEALQGTCRDLRGISRAANSKKTYLMLLSKLFPHHISTLSGFLEVFHDDAAVVVAVFKFMAELVSNKAQR